MRIPVPWYRWAIVAATLLAAEPAHAFRYVEAGSPAPALALEDLQGRAVKVPGAGRVTVVVFWRPGQQLSEEALADLAGLAASRAAADVDLVAVAEGGTDREASRRQGAKLALRFLLDRDGRAGEAYGIIVFPSTAVIGPDGRLRHYLPSRTPGYPALVEAHVLRARGAISEEELAMRAATAGEVYGAAAEAAQAAYRRGLAHIREKRYPEARGALTEALRRAPGNLDAQLQLGYVELELGEPALALTQFETVLKRNPASAAGRAGRGIARLRLGDTEEGIRLLEEAVVLNPEPVRAHWELAQAYEARGEMGRALDHYRWAYRKLLQGRK